MQPKMTHNTREESSTANPVNIDELTTDEEDNTESDEAHRDASQQRENSDSETQSGNGATELTVQGNQGGGGIVAEHENRVNIIAREQNQDQEFDYQGVALGFLNRGLDFVLRLYGENPDNDDDVNEQNTAHFLDLVRNERYDDAANYLSSGRHGFVGINQQINEIPVINIALQNRAANLVSEILNYSSSQNGVQLNAGKVDLNHDTALLCAIRHADWDTAIRLLNQEVVDHTRRVSNFVEVANRYFDTPIETSWIDTGRAVVAASTNKFFPKVNASNNDGRTALILACERRGQLLGPAGALVNHDTTNELNRIDPVIAYILQDNAINLSRSSQGEEALRILIPQGAANLVQCILMISAKASRSPLGRDRVVSLIELALNSDQAQVVTLLIEYLTKKNEIIPRLELALLAIRHNHKGLLKFILSSTSLASILPTLNENADEFINNAFEIIWTLEEMQPDITQSLNSYLEVNTGMSERSNGQSALNSIRSGLGDLARELSDRGITRVAKNRQQYEQQAAEESTEHTSDNGSELSSQHLIIHTMFGKNAQSACSLIMHAGAGIAVVCAVVYAMSDMSTTNHPLSI